MYRTDPESAFPEVFNAGSGFGDHESQNSKFCTQNIIFYYLVFSYRTVPISHNLKWVKTLCRVNFTFIIKNLIEIENNDPVTQMKTNPYIPEWTSPTEALPGP
jgi:hypothetical protein